MSSVSLLNMLIFFLNIMTMVTVTLNILVLILPSVSSAGMFLLIDFSPCWLCFPVLILSKRAFKLCSVEPYRI